MSPPYTEQRLADIERQMRLQVANVDFDDAHRQADALLVETVEALIEFSGGTDEGEYVQRIIAAYKQIGKWYA